MPRKNPQMRSYALSLVTILGEAGSASHFAPTTHLYDAARLMWDATIDLVCSDTSLEREVRKICKDQGLTAILAELDQCKIAPTS